MLGLWLLIDEPGANVRWEDHHAHFWIVVLAAAASVALALMVFGAAGRRRDARLGAVSLAFLSSAAFLGLHALATPGVIVDAANLGFDIASAVGLVLGSVFAAASAIELSPRLAERIVTGRFALFGVVLAISVVWGALSLGGVPPLSDMPEMDSRQAVLTGGAIAGCVLYGIAAARFLWRWRTTRAPVPLATATAFVLLGEALIAAAFGRNWHLSWWEWHLLMAAGFVYVLHAARLEGRRDGGVERVFDQLALDRTIEAVRADYGAALERYVDAVRSDRKAAATTAAALAQRFDLTSSQVDVLQRAGDALAAEREQLRRLGALVAVGRRTRVLVSEDALLGDALDEMAGVLDGQALQLALIRNGTLELPAALARGDGAAPTAQAARDLAAAAVERLEPVAAEDGAPGAVALPLVVKERPAGALVVTGLDAPLADRDRAILESLASQLSIALENVRLYRELDGLFRSYLSPDVATTLIADPAQAALGGARFQVSVLMADLQGFTPFSERTSPEDVVTMLNTVFTAVVPPILARGGTVTQFVGDAIMALFGAPVRHADHAQRAAAAALELQAAAAAALRDQPGWPRFRCAVNSGPALVGNVGAHAIRTFTAIGDTTNLAARLEGLAGPGEVVVGAQTAAALTGANLQPLGPTAVKGKSAPVEAFRLLSLEPARPHERGV